MDYEALSGVYRVKLAPIECDLDGATRWVAEFVGTDVRRDVDPITMYTVATGYGTNQYHPLGRLNMAWSLLYYHLRHIRKLSHSDAKVSLKNNRDNLNSFANCFLVPIGFQLRTPVSTVDIWLMSNWNDLHTPETPVVPRPDWLDEDVPKI